MSGASPAWNPSSYGAALLRLPSARALAGPAGAGRGTSLLPPPNGATIPVWYRPTAQKTALNLNMARAWPLLEVLMVQVRCCGLAGWAFTGTVRGRGGDGGHTHSHQVGVCLYASNGSMQDVPGRPAASPVLCERVVWHAACMWRGCCGRLLWQRTMSA